MLSNSLYTYLLISIFLFIIGLYGLMQHKSFIGMLISIELILNASGLNFMAFNRFVSSDHAVGQIFVIFIMGIAAAEAAIVVSFVLAVYRKYSSIDPEQVTDLKY